MTIEFTICGICGKSYEGVGPLVCDCQPGVKNERVTLSPYTADDTECGIFLDACSDCGETWYCTKEPNHEGEHSDYFHACQAPHLTEDNGL